ncbi:crinkler family protein [Gigaspora margarita]|uniref:Crinkler family protein n=1 Tax=Gigaspora margarita TaxID=4874 RepID=A0A8H3XEK2_GIGMA|nr:crinkler family protein [Gigaspora margarita]
MSSVVISGTPITIICLVLEREVPFKVVIGRNNDVFDLKRIILNEKPNDLATIDDDNLKLLKLDKPVPGEDIEELRKITFQNNENLKLLVGTKDIADYWPEDQIPIRKHIHVIVELLDSISAGRKRTFDGSLLIDNSNAICNGLLQKFEIIPRKVCELQQLINAPLLRKLPVTSDEEKIYPELDRFVCTKDDERRSTIAKNISAALCSTIDRKISGNNSECMLHYPLDTMIRVPLETFNRFLGSVLPIEIDRDDTDSGTMTDGTKRPDFLCWVNNLLILKGEEEASADNLYMARNELVEKFSVLNPVFFDKFQYMICYAAAGSSIGFYAIDGSEGAVQRLIALTNSLDASNHIDRITILLEKRVLKADLPYSEDLNSRIQFLESMYQYAKGYPGLVQIEKGPVVTKKFYKIVMKTRGIPCLLITEDELREMAKSVLTGLARLHGGNFVHRDIKLSNILYIPGSCENFKYFLIDFEHGGFNKQKPGELLTGWDENTLTNAGCYTSTSDMYQFGKLLERYNNLMTTDDGKDFTNRLKSKCMTAAMALKHKWINNKVSTST